MSTCDCCVTPGTIVFLRSDADRRCPMVVSQLDVFGAQVFYLDVVNVAHHLLVPLPALCVSKHWKSLHHPTAHKSEA